MTTTVRNIGSFAFSYEELKEIKQRMLNWTKQFSILAFMDSNSYPDRYGKYEVLMATGCLQQFLSPEAVEAAFGAHPDWIFGHVAYDYKNTLEPGLRSDKVPAKGFGDLFFFVPETVCYIERGANSIVIETNQDPAAIFSAILATTLPVRKKLPLVEFDLRIQKDAYINTIQQIRDHIREGDCYELNFCNEGYTIAAIENPMDLFLTLNSVSPAPFACYYRNNDSYLVCASPERYLRKAGRNVVSQPIKGTAARSTDPLVDEQMRNNLRNSEKECAENVMIADLVRNDLARCCKPGTVEVAELLGIYSFPSVHQMITTVTGRLNDGIGLLAPLRCSFPMGSMTGAPKFKVMELIEEYEFARRGLYSGTVGYISPLGDFDFNVVIRSLFYNASSNYLCFQSGGAITWDSDPTSEWDEMILKATAMSGVFR